MLVLQWYRFKGGRWLARCWCMWVRRLQQNCAFCAGADASESCTCTSRLLGRLLLCFISRLCGIMLRACVRGGCRCRMLLYWLVPDLVLLLCGFFLSLCCRAQTPTCTTMTAGLHWTWPVS